MRAWYYVSTSQFIWLISFISRNMKKKLILENGDDKDVSIAGPDLTVNSAPASVVAFNFNILFCAADHWLPMETTWAEVWLGARLLLTTYVCGKERQRRGGRWQTAWPGCQLPLGSHYDLSRVQAPFPRFLRTSARLRYCFGGQLNVRLTERLQRKSPERKQKWSKGPFPTLFLAPVCPRRLKRTLPKQRVCLCRCPNSQPTHICTLAHRQRHTHAGT